MIATIILGIIQIVLAYFKYKKKIESGWAVVLIPLYIIIFIWMVIGVNYFAAKMLQSG